MFSPINTRLITPTSGPISSVNTDNAAQLNHEIDSLKQGSTQKTEAFAVTAPMNAGIERVGNSDKEMVRAALAALESQLKGLAKWLVDAESFDGTQYSKEMKSFSAGYIALMKRMSESEDGDFWDPIEKELDDIYKEFAEYKKAATGDIDASLKNIALERDSAKVSSFEDAQAISTEPLSPLDNPPNISLTSRQRAENLNISAESAWLAMGIERLAKLVEEKGDAQMKAAFDHLLSAPNTHRNNISSAHQTSLRAGSRTIGVRGRQRVRFVCGSDADDSDSA